MHKSLHTKFSIFKNVYKYSYTKYILCLNDYSVMATDKDEICYKKRHSSDELENLSKWIKMYCSVNSMTCPVLKEKNMHILNNLSEKERVIFLKKIIIRESRDLKKLVKKKKVKEKKSNEHLTYGLWQNAMFGKMYQRSFKQYCHQKAYNSLLSGHPIVIDCNYDQFMHKTEMIHFCKQIEEISNRNSTSFNPFSLNLCNVKPDSDLIKYLYRKDISKYSPNYYLNISSKSYDELFPIDEVIYLSPDARVTMTHFDSNAVYIIGGIVDLNSNDAITLAHCRNKKIKTMKLPLDQYVVCKGRKELAIYTVVAILQQLQNTGKWEKAFRKLPKRVVKEMLQ